jgi:prepilin-type N-terminal cleavage/methylation domain-containing protein
MLISRPHRAFTLPEMMLVVALIGVVSAIGLPRVSSMLRERSASNAVQQFGRALQSARDNALDLRRCVHITRSAANVMQRDVLAIDTAGACTATVESSDSVTFNASNLSIPAGLDITFNIAGGLNGVTGDSITVTVDGLTDMGNRPRSFKIYRLLGLVRAL